jgi:hypothetical protein
MKANIRLDPNNSQGLLRPKTDNTREYPMVSNNQMKLSLIVNQRRCFRGIGGSFPAIKGWTVAVAESATDPSRT